MIEKQPSRKPGKVLVTFRVDRSVWADRISLAGDFNDWDGDCLNLERSHMDPDWHVTVELDAGQRYRFGYLMDGREWTMDRDADDFETDPRGRVKCVVNTDLGRRSVDGGEESAAMPLMIGGLRVNQT